MGLAKDLIADAENRRREKRLRKKFKSSVQNKGILPYINDVNVGATLYTNVSKNVKTNEKSEKDKPKLAKKLSAVDQKRLEGKWGRFDSWDEHFANWIAALEEVVEDFQYTERFAPDKIESREDVDKLVKWHTSFNIRFNDIWCLLFTDRKYSKNPKSIEVIQRQMEDPKRRGYHKFGYLGSLASYWSNNSGIPVEEFIGEFVIAAYELARWNYDDESDYFFGEQLKTVLKSRALDIIRREKGTEKRLANKRRANYDAISLDAVRSDGVNSEITLLDTLRSNGPDPLAEALRKDYFTDSRFTDEKRTVISMVYDGYTHAEIASELGTYHQKIGRILARMREKMANDLLDPTRETD